MNARKILIITVVALSLVGICHGLEADKGIPTVDFEITTDFFSKYIWRGQNLSDDSVFQTGINLSYSKLTATIWSNMDLTNINGNSGDFSELDYC